VGGGVRGNEDCLGGQRIAAGAAILGSMADGSGAAMGKRETQGAAMVVGTRRNEGTLARGEGGLGGGESEHRE